MKKIRIIIILISLHLYYKNIFANLNNVFNMDILDRNIIINSNELFIEQNVLGGYNHIKFNLETRLYYRLHIYKGNINYLFKDTKIDIGIENNFSLSSDMIGLWIDIKPLSFFGIRISGYLDFMYNAMNFGYKGFDDNNVNYDFNALYSMDKTSAFGYIISAKPYFIFKFKNFIIIDNFSINFVDVGKNNYYYDPRTAILHKKREFELINDFYLIGNINPFYIGGYYGLIYLANSKHFSNKIGLVGLLNFKFIQEKLIFKIGASAGLHIGTPNFNNQTFIELKLSLAYKIL